MYRIGPNDCSLSPNANGGREVPIISLMMLRTSDVILGQWEWKKLKRHLNKCVVGREFPNTFQRLTFKFCKIALFSFFVMSQAQLDLNPAPTHPGTLQGHPYLCSSGDSEDTTAEILKTPNF